MTFRGVRWVAAWALAVGVAACGETPGDAVMGGHATSATGGGAGGRAPGAGGGPQGASGGGGAMATGTTTASTTSSTTGAGACAGKPSVPADQVVTLPWGGVDRNFRVHTPPGYDGTVPTPAVLVFHGLTETKEAIESLTKMTPVTDAHGAIVVYAQGIANSWNAGTCCGTAASDKVDDVGFVNAMIDALVAAYCVDERRVFATGFSNGGMLSHRLGCELSARIAAIGPVSGTIAIEPCQPSRPVPVQHFHGTSDFIVGYGISFGQAKSVPDTIAGWVARNGCGSPPASTFASGDAHCEAYSGCSDGATVSLCTLEGGGHQWPGGETTWLGTLNTDIFASEALLAFFEAHPMP